jgi:hypothetical protein
MHSRDEVLAKDRNQYLVVGAGDTLYGFVMLAKEPSRQLSQRTH